MNNIKHRNHLLFFYSLIIGIIIVIVALPTIRKSQLAPPNTYYTRVHRAHPDYYSLISYIRQGKTQSIQVNQFTTEKTMPFRSHHLYNLLGKIGMMTNISDIDMYYLGIYVPLLIFVIYTISLVRLIIPQKYQIWTLFLIFFAGPFPKTEFMLWGQKITFGPPNWMGLDIYSRLTMKPHHMLATALMIGTVYYLYKFNRKQNWTYLILTVVSLIISITIYAIPGLFITLTLGIFIFFTLLIKLWTRYSHKKNAVVSDYSLSPFFLFGCFLIFSASLITFFYITTMLLQSTIVQDGKILNILTWENQAFAISKHSFGRWLLDYLVSFGFLPILLIPGVLYLRQNYKFEYIFIFLLFLVSFFLYLLTILNIIQLPVVRLVYWAPFVFMGILSSLGIIYLWVKISAKSLAKKVLLFIFILFLVNAITDLKIYWYDELSPRDFWQYNYLPLNYLKAFSYLNFNTPKYSNTMASYYTGMIIPAFTYNKVFIGHEASTYDFAYKWWFAQEFMAGTLSPESAKKILDDYQINYVFWDSGTLPSSYSLFLHPIYQIDNIFIYQKT